jgi:hypothetical protein
VNRIGVKRDLRAPHGYLDKYSIAESIEGGTTVKLQYTLAPNPRLPDGHRTPPTEQQGPSVVPRGVDHVQ